MAAGLGYKEFTTGDVLTAADANGYLASQVVMVFASAAARTSAIASPQEGMISYLKDTDVTQSYSGSAWVTIGGSSPLTTKGDLYTYSTTNARLGVGTNGQILTADSAEATGLKWATAAGGGKVLQVVSTVATTAVSNTNAALYIDTGLTATITPTSATSKILAIFNHQAIFRASAADQMLMKFYRNATQIYETSLMYLPISIGAGMEGTCILVHMDSPATTSATTYKTQFRPSSGATVTVQASNFPSSLTLLEIGA